MATLYDNCEDWRRAVSAAGNATNDSGFTNPAKSVNPPTPGDQGTTVYGGVHYLGGSTTDGTRGSTRHRIIVAPFGTGSNNDTGQMRVWGWKPLRGSTSGLGVAHIRIWKPILLCQYTITLSSTLVGLASSPLAATDLDADTLALVHPLLPTTGEGTVVNTFSPGSDSLGDISPAHFLLDIRGFDVIEFGFNRNSSATSLNALWCQL